MSEINRSESSENLSEKTLSSYQKGINRLLEHQDKFERLIIEYILSVNSKYNSNMFPTPQIAKILLAKLNMKKTQFPIIHKIVRTILDDWNKHGWCEYITTTKSGRNRRTKFIYSFSEENYQFFKTRFISSSISAIEQEIESDPEEIIKDTMKTREGILESWIDDMNDALNAIMFDDEDLEDEDKIDPDEPDDPETIH